jgi:peptide/nickel transport system substrate-binding protein
MVPRKPAKFATFVLIGCLAVMAAACSGTSPRSNAQSGGTTASLVKAGGTLRLGTPNDPGNDPQQDYNIFEVFWCCTSRTLLSLNLLPANQGGTALYPDLASSMPTVSSDSLTWTFHIKPNIHYSPPFQNTVVTSKDFVTALEREANPQGSVGGYSFYYSVIQGFDAYSKGSASSITGLSTPNATTLVIHLTAPTGDLGYRLALPAAAPIPPGAEALTTHLRDYGRYLVSTGPYMVAGSQNLNFSLPASQQTPLSGYQPGEYLDLVRNPSWQASTDSLRKAYPDRIDFQLGGTVADLANKVEAGTLDELYDVNPPASVIQHYETDPQLKGLIHSNATGHLQFIGMNMAQPPFDDIHVRRALNYVLDKAALQRVFSGPIGGPIMGHVLTPNLSGGQLNSYNPLSTPGESGDLSKAKAEMMLSKYDPKHDGMCDVPACKNVLAVTRSDSVYPDLATIEQQDFAELGITLNIKEVDFSSIYSECPNLSAHVGLCLGIYWGPDYPDAFTEINPLFGSTSLGPNCCNVTAMGATAQLLASAGGYGSTVPPSVDAKIAACVPKTGAARISCWNKLDEYITSQIVPIVPYLNDHNIEIVSPRVVNYNHDVIGYISLNVVALKNGGK